MFKFNFSAECNDSNDEQLGAQEKEVKWLESREIDPHGLKIVENCKNNNIKCGDLTIKYISSEDVIDVLKEDKNSDKNSVISAEQNHSDLITAVYEGGLKIWECTYDLLNLITTNNIKFRDKTVLDLGCGAGILGILAALKGAASYFQDYNSEVISNITIANAIINGLQVEKHKFYCGDWKSFMEKLQKQQIKFDLIFTSETIYNTENYMKLVNVFKTLLTKDGTIYLAAKYYYFGVGGGIAQFLDLLSIDDVFVYKIIWECSDGVKRAVIKINFK